MKIRCGIIGYGMSAKTFHIPFIEALEDFELAAVSTSRREELSANHPGTRHHVDADALLSDSDLDLVIITSPNTTHFGYAKQALTQGLHVVVEKPFTVTYGEAEQLVKVAAQSDKILTVYHNRRWDGDFLTLSELLESGKLGNLSHFETHFDRFRPAVRDRWRERAEPGAGLLYDLGSHMLDQCVFLFGTPDWIQADIARQRPGAQIDDYVHMVLAYGRMRAEVHISSVVNSPSPRFAIHGDGGSFVKYGLDPQENQLKAGLAVDHPDFGKEDEDASGSWHPAPEGSPVQIIPSVPGRYKDFYTILARAVRGNEAPPVLPEDAAMVIRLIEMAQKSADTGRRINI